MFLFHFLLYTQQYSEHGGAESCSRVDVTYWQKNTHYYSPRCVYFCTSKDRMGKNNIYLHWLKFLSFHSLLYTQLHHRFLPQRTMQFHTMNRQSISKFKKTCTIKLHKFHLSSLWTELVRQKCHTQKIDLFFLQLHIFKGLLYCSPSTPEVLSHVVLSNSPVRKIWVQVTLNKPRDESCNRSYRHNLLEDWTIWMDVTLNIAEFITICTP